MNAEAMNADPAKALAEAIALLDRAERAEAERDMLLARIARARKQTTGMGDMMGGDPAHWYEKEILAALDEMPVFSNVPHYVTVGGRNYGEWRFACSAPNGRGCHSAGGFYDAVAAQEHAREHVRTHHEGQRDGDPRPRIIPAMDVPSYEDLADMSLEDRDKLPARFHIPVPSVLATPKSYICAVCWDEGTVCGWPCAAAIRGIDDVFQGTQ